MNTLTNLLATAYINISGRLSETSPRANYIRGKAGRAESTSHLLETDWRLRPHSVCPSERMNVGSTRPHFPLIIYNLQSLPCLLSSTANIGAFGVKWRPGSPSVRHRAWIKLVRCSGRVSYVNAPIIGTDDDLVWFLPLRGTAKGGLYLAWACLWGVWFLHNWLSTWKMLL